MLVKGTKMNGSCARSFMSSVSAISVCWSIGFAIKILTLVDTA